jgi:hypothetical protein
MAFVATTISLVTMATLCGAETFTLSVGHLAQYSTSLVSYHFPPSCRHADES